MGGCGSDRGDAPDALTRIVLEPSTTEEAGLTEDELSLSMEIMRERLDRLDVRDPSLEQEGKAISVILPSDRADDAVPLLTRPGRLEFFDLQADLVAGVSLDAQGFPRASTKPLAPRPNTVVASCRRTARYCPGVADIPARTYYYLFKYDPNDRAHPIPELTGADLELKGTRQDFDMVSGEPIVLMQFTSSGAKKFHEITRELAIRGRSVAGRLNIDDEIAFQQFAIVLDGVIQSAPVIDFNENPDGIPGDAGAQITGIGSLSEARQLALVLQTGALPAEFHVVSREEARKNG
jgi:preprotein translocase subunit SecD